MLARALLLSLCGALVGAAPDARATDATDAPDVPDAPDALDAPDAADTSVEAWLFADEAYRMRAASLPFAGFDHDARLLIDGGVLAFDGTLGADVSAALFWDIDGKSPPGLASVHDARAPLNLYVDTLEVHASREEWRLVRASAGRLTVQEGWPITLDGAAIALAPIANDKLTWSVFGSAGRTVHFFEIDDDAFEDWAASIGTNVALAGGLKLEVDYRALVEDSHKAGAPAHSYGVGFWRRIDDALLLHLFGRGIDDELSHVGARTHLAWTPWGVGLHASAVQQVATLGEVFEGANPYFAVLGESLPHLRASVDAFATRDVELFTGTLHVGASARQRFAGEDAPFNRNAARVYASADADDIVIGGLFSSLIVSYDFATDSDDSAVLALGGALGFKSKLFRLSAGTSWDRVKYTYYRDVAELTDVRTVFANGEWRAWRILRVRGEYTLELAAQRTIHSLHVGIAHDLEGSL